MTFCMLCCCPPRPSEYLDLFFPVLRAQGELVSSIPIFRSLSLLSSWPIRSHLL
jgi:hypothetical protein